MVKLEMITQINYLSDVFFAGGGVEKFEVNDFELLEFLDQFDDVSFGQTDAGFRLLCELELPLQFQKFLIHSCGGGAEVCESRLPVVVIVGGITCSVQFYFRGFFLISGN